MRQTSENLMTLLRDSGSLVPPAWNHVLLELKAQNSSYKSSFHIPFLAEEKRKRQKSAYKTGFTEGSRILPQDTGSLQIDSPTHSYQKGWEVYSLPGRAPVSQASSKI